MNGREREDIPVCRNSMYKTWEARKDRAGVGGPNSLLGGVQTRDGGSKCWRRLGGKGIIHRALRKTTETCTF